MKKRKKTPQESAAGGIDLMAYANEGGVPISSGGAGLGYGGLYGSGDSGGGGGFQGESPVKRYPLTELPDSAQTGPSAAPPPQPKTSISEAVGRTAAESFVPGVHAIKGALGGVGEYIGDKLAERANPGIPRSGLTLGETFTRNVDRDTERLALAQEEHPVASAVTGIATAFAPGSVAANTGKVVSKLPQAARLAPTAINAATGAIGGAAQEGAAGRDPVSGALTGAATGAGLGVVGGVIGRAATAVRDKIRSDKSQLGRGIQASERLYGDDAVGVMGAKGREGLDKGERGIAQLGREGADELHDVGEQARRAAGQEYDAAVKNLGYKEVDPMILRIGLDNAIRSTEAKNGTVLFPELRNRLDLARKALDNPGAQGAAGSADTLFAGVGGDKVPLEDVLKIKRMLDDSANWGMPATPEQAQLRKAATSFADLINRTDPALGEAQKRYAGRMAELERYHGGLYGKEEPAIPDTGVMKRRLASRLGVQGTGENVPSAAQTELEFKGVREEFPDVGPILDLPLAERFRQSIQLGAPKATVTSAGPIMRSNLGTLEDIALSRAAYPAVRATERAAPGLPTSGNLIMNAAQAKRKKKDKKE
jgi:hypothetical protein